jgi:alkyl hydroperoxide reductase subunit AhpF
VIPLKDQETLKARFARDLASRVRIDFFGRKPSPIFIAGRSETTTSEDVRKLLRELSGLSERISLSQFDIDTDAQWAEQLGVDKAPAIVIRGQANRALRFFGLPNGQPFLALVEMIVLASRPAPTLKPETAKALKKLREGVEVKVFVQRGCPYSGAMAIIASQLTLASPRIDLEIVEAKEFPQLGQHNVVRMTPLTVLNNEYAIPGLMDETALAGDIVEASQGRQPATGGDPSKLTPIVEEQQAQQGPRYSAGGIFLPR